MMKVLLQVVTEFSRKYNLNLKTFVPEENVLIIYSMITEAQVEKGLMWHLLNGEFCYSPRKENKRKLNEVAFALKTSVWHIVTFTSWKSQNKQKSYSSLWGDCTFHVTHQSNWVCSFHNFFSHCRMFYHRLNHFVQQHLIRKTPVVQSRVKNSTFVSRGFQNISISCNVIRHKLHDCNIKLTMFESESTFNFNSTALGVKFRFYCSLLSEADSI